jgi:hypothetical protein
MNKLSWLLYLANVSDNIGSLFWYLMLFIFIGVLIWCIAGLGQSADGSTDKVFWKGWRRVGYFLFPAFLLVFLIGSFIPDKKTVYLIAASEAGETVVHSETGQKAIDAVNRYLDGVAKATTEDDKK